MLIIILILIFLTKYYVPELDMLLYILFITSKYKSFNYSFNFNILLIKDYPP